MKYYVVDKETGEMVDIIKNPTMEDIKKYESPESKQYIIDEKTFEGGFDEDDLNFNDINLDEW